MNWFLEVGSYELRIPFTDAHVPFPWNVERHRVAGRLQPPADADHLRPARPDRARGRVRVPLRHVQHRRPGPVPGRRDHGRLGRLGAARPARPRPHPARGRRRRARGRPAGRDRRLPEGDRRHPRGDLDDHAQLDRGLDRACSCSGSAGRSRTTRSRSSRSRTTSLDKAKLGIFWGDPALQALHVGFFVALGSARRLLAHPQPDDARLRGARGRLQPRGGALRRHLGGAELLPRDGDLGRVRRPRGRDRHRRLAVPDQHERRADLVADRLRRASPWRCSGATRRSASGSRRCSSPR